MSAKLLRKEENKADASRVSPSSWKRMKSHYRALDLRTRKKTRSIVQVLSARDIILCFPPRLHIQVISYFK